MGAVGVGSHPLEGGSRVWGPRAPHPRQAGFPRGGSGHHRSRFQMRGHKPWVPATPRAPTVSQGPRGPGSCWAPSPDRDLGRGRWGSRSWGSGGSMEAACGCRWEGPRSECLQRYFSGILSLLQSLPRGVFGGARSHDCPGPFSKLPRARASAPNGGQALLRQRRRLKPQRPRPSRPRLLPTLHPQRRPRRRKSWAPSGGPRANCSRASGPAPSGDCPRPPSSAHRGSRRPLFWKRRA